MHYTYLYMYVYTYISFFRRIAHPSESINSGRDSELLLTSSGQGYLTSLGRTNLLLLLSILLSFLLLFHLSLFLTFPLRPCCKTVNFQQLMILS